MSAAQCATGNGTLRRATVGDPLLFAGHGADGTLLATPEKPDDARCRASLPCPMSRAPDGTPRSVPTSSPGAASWSATTARRGLARERLADPTVAGAIALRSGGWLRSVYLGVGCKHRGLLHAGFCRRRLGERPPPAKTPPESGSEAMTNAELRAPQALIEPCACGHPPTGHDPTAARFCAATRTGHLRRSCICVPDDSEPLSRLTGRMERTQ
jgi:hypothetical protein